MFHIPYVIGVFRGNIPLRDRLLRRICIARYGASAKGGDIFALRTFFGRTGKVSAKIIDTERSKKAVHYRLNRTKFMATDDLSFHM